MAAPGTHALAVLVLTVSGLVSFSTAAELGRVQSWLRPARSNSSRIWGSVLLNSSILNFGNLFQAKNLLDKLQAGKSIRVTALGSSLVQDTSGCFHSSLDALWQFPDVVPNPNIYASQGHELIDGNDVAIERCKGGFMTTVMQNINHTWPHKDHIYYNNGKGGANLDSIFKAGCISSYFPDDIDLVVLDPITNVGSVEGAEALLRQMLRKKSQPLVIILSNGRNCMDRDWTRCVVKCMNPLYDGNYAETATHCAVSELKDMYGRKDADKWQRETVQPFQDLAVHYDVPHLSIHAALDRLMNGPKAHEAPEDVPPKGALDYPASDDTYQRMQMLSNFFIDSVHANKYRLGVMLISDIIVNYLWIAQERLKAMSQADKDALQYNKASTEVYHGSNAAFLQRCYGTTLKTALEHLNGSKVVQTDLENKEGIHHAIKWMLPGDTYTGFANENVITKPGDEQAVNLQGHRTFPPLAILHQEKWVMQVSYKNPKGELKIKPGWITNTSGARLVFEVDTEWPGVRTVGDPQVVITYVKSYAGWGQVQVACANCLCNTTVLDAHWDKKVSLNHYYMLNTTQHKHCQVSVTVLDSTSSTGHNWKLVHVVARIQEYMAPTQRRSLRPVVQPPDNWREQWTYDGSGGPQWCRRQ